MSVSLNEGLERLLDNNTCEEQKRKQKKLFKEESVGEDVARYQKWVDYDMKRYGEVSEKTKDSLEKAGLSLVKDQYGEYEVIADEKIHESCNCKKRFLKEGASNFYSMSNFPLLIFGDDEDVYDRVWDMTKEELGGKVDDDEIDQTEEFENNWETYFDYCTLTSEEQSELQDELKEINDKLETLRYTKEDELESDFEIAKIEIRPGYYEALQLFVPDEKYLEDWQIDAINDALEGLKKEYGLTELGVAYRASNGETGYKKVESVEECNLNEAKLVDRKTFGGIHNIFGKKVWVTGELSDTRDYRWEDVRIEDASGDLLGFGRYKWLNRPWQRFTYDVAFTKAVRDAFGDTAAKKAEEAVENSSGIDGALKWLEEHEEKDECLTENVTVYRVVDDNTGDTMDFENRRDAVDFARKKGLYAVKVTLNDEGDVVNESVISDRIRKGDLDYEDEVDAYSVKDGDTYVQFQDRETHETRLKGEKDKWGNLRITGREDRQPRVSSHTIARIWKKDKDGKVTFDRVEGPKYLVRQDVARMFDKDESLTEADVTDQVIIDTHKDGFLTKKAELRDKGYKTLWVGNGKICMYKPKEAVTEAHKEQADEDAVRELVLYAENDSRIYRNRTLPVIANLKRKVAKGVFDKELAVKAFQYVADDAAKQYKKEFPAEDDGTYDYNFNPATREEVARQLLDRYIEQIEEK